MHVSKKGDHTPPPIGDNRWAEYMHHRLTEKTAQPTEPKQQGRRTKLERRRHGFDAATAAYKAFPGDNDNSNSNTNNEDPKPCTSSLCDRSSPSAAPLQKRNRDPKAGPWMEHDFTDPIGPDGVDLWDVLVHRWGEQRGNFELDIAQLRPGGERGQEGKYVGINKGNFHPDLTPDQLAEANGAKGGSAGGSITSAPVGGGLPIGI